MEVMTLYPLDTRVKGPANSKVERRSFLRRLGDSFSGELSLSRHIRRKRSSSSRSTVPGALLHEQILSYLTIDDITDLSLVCKEVNRHIRQYRRYLEDEDFSFLRKRRHETRVRLEPWGLNGEVGVWQLQRFSMLIKVDRKEVYQVDLGFANYLWDERANCRYAVGAEEGSLAQSGQPYDTILDQIRITRIKHKRAPSLLFLYQAEAETAWINGTDVGCLGEVDAKLDTRLRKSLYTVMRCCNELQPLFSPRSRKLKKTKHKYPSAEFAMRQLPRFLYPYFPESFDWHRPALDRVFVPEFCYAAAPSMKEWNSLMPKRKVIEYRISEIPWYRRD